MNKTIDYSMPDTIVTNCYHRAADSPHVKQENEIEVSAPSAIESIVSEQVLMKMNYINKALIVIDTLRHPIAFPELSQSQIKQTTEFDNNSLTGENISTYKEDLSEYVDCELDNSVSDTLYKTSSENQEFSESEKDTFQQYDNSKPDSAGGVFLAQVEIAQQYQNKIINKEFEEALRKVQSKNPEIAERIRTGNFHLKTREEYPENTLGRYDTGETHFPENDGDPFVIVINTRNEKNEKRSDLDIAEDIVHEYYHAEMGEKLKIRNSDLKDEHFYPFFRTVGESLSYKKGVEFKESLGGASLWHKHDADRFGRQTDLINLYVNRKAPGILNDKDRDTYESIKNNFNKLDNNQKKKVHEILDYYYKAIK